MGTLSHSLCGYGALSLSSPPSQAIPRFHRPNGVPRSPPKLTQDLSLNSLGFRIKGALSRQAGQNRFVAYASNSNPSGQDSIQEKSDGKESDAAQGPPFLTILAGLLVFFVVFWIIGSIVIWLISLIANLPPST
ncbi:hypothetical protein TorRG33x02_230440 [Trema orientale]|uniref:Transmembrane protein n=1 Tax=Trema orientale TaxID=63057 RepID=A0A2P5E6Q5_TREOI|nr:hypothetical protein TorRG33x02_230440 [Trema orientale]